MNSTDLKQLVAKDLQGLLAERSDKLVRQNEKGFIDDLDEITGILSRIDPAPSPILNAIDHKGQDFGTYFFASYSDTRDLEKSLLIYKTVKSLVRYILLMDRFYEVGNKRYMTIAKALIKSVKQQHRKDGSHLSYSIEFSLKQFWPFWDFEQLMKRRMMDGHAFGVKELRYHNLFKSSDAPIIYATVLDCELPNFNPNVAKVLHYNQALEDIQDDFEDIEEDVRELMPNVFVLAASDRIPLSKLLKDPEQARKLIISRGSADSIMSIIDEYDRLVKETPLPPSFTFLKYLARDYVDKLSKTLNTSSKY